MLGRRTRRATWLAWSLWSLAALLVVVSVPLEIANGGHDASLLLTNVFGVALATAGALIASRRPANPLGWLFIAMSLLLALVYVARGYAIYGLLTRPGSLPGAVFMAWLEQWPLWFVFPGGISLILLLFPTGRPPSRRWWPVVWFTVGCSLLMVIGSMFVPSKLGDALRNPSGPIIHFGVANPVGIGPLKWLLGLMDIVGRLGGFLLALVAAAGFIVRFVHSDGEQRQQLKWVAYVGTLIILGIFGGLTLLGPFPTLQNAAFLLLVVGGQYVGLPAAAAIAILKYRLYDIDVVINKSLVYGALAVFITAVYVAVVVGIGTVIGTGGKPNLALSILATAVVAVAFQPVRLQIQRFVNRLIFGERPTPYEAMADFSDRMTGILSVEAVLPRMAEAAARAVAARVGRVHASFANRNEIVVWPASSSADRMDLIVPVAYRGERLGEISVAKSPGESVSAGDRKLLIDLAAQAGLVLHNVRLAAELQARLDEISTQAAAIRASRQRIVGAQAIEQQRLEKTIHDGAEAALEAIKSEIARVERMLSSDPGSAATLLDQLTARANNTLEILRDLARGIYPPLLRDQGLAAALRAQIEKLQLPVVFTTDDVDRYPAELEAAAYVCCVEALRASQPPVTLTLSSTHGALEFSITASRIELDGRVQDIEDRIEAVGGTLRFANDGIVGQIPIAILEAVP